MSVQLNHIRELAYALSERFGSTGDPYRALASLTEELGEVAAEINKLHREGAKQVQGKEGHRALLQEELGDVLLRLFYLANALEVDLEAEMEAKCRRLRERFGLSRQPDSRPPGRR